MQHGAVDKAAREPSSVFLYELQQSNHVWLSNFKSVFHPATVSCHFRVKSLRLSSTLSPQPLLTCNCVSVEFAIANTLSGSVGPVSQVPSQRMSSEK